MRLPKVIPSKWFFDTNDGLVYKIQGKLRLEDTRIGKYRSIAKTFGTKIPPLPNIKYSINLGKKELKDIINLELEELSTFDTTEKYNGSIGGIPILTQSIKRNYKNSTTKQTSFSKNEFIDNMTIETYSLSLELIVYGVDVKDKLNKLVELANKKNVISFTDNKSGLTYAPVVITSLSYLDDVTTQNVYIVSLEIEEVRLLDEKEQGVKIVDNAFKRNNTVKNVNTKGKGRKTVKNSAKASQNVNKKGKGEKIFIYTEDYSEYKYLKNKYKNNSNYHIIKQETKNSREYFAEYQKAGVY